MADLNSKNIESIAEDPKRVTVDGNTAEQFSLQEQIAAAHFVASKAAATSNKRGFSIQKLKAPGSQ